MGFFVCFCNKRIQQLIWAFLSMKLVEIAKPIILLRFLPLEFIEINTV